MGARRIRQAATQRESKPPWPVGIGADEQALRLAETGAHVLLLSDRDFARHVNVFQQPAALLAELEAPFPLQPFDIVLCQRALCAMPYAEARKVTRSLLGRLKIGGKLFMSAYGIHSELGDQYPDGGSWSATGWHR